LWLFCPISSRQELSSKKRLPTNDFFLKLVLPDGKYISKFIPFSSAPFARAGLFGTGSRRMVSGHGERGTLGEQTQGAWI
jgi:hypothetical protein